MSGRELGHGRGFPQCFIGPSCNCTPSAGRFLPGRCRFGAHSRFYLPSSEKWNIHLQPHTSWRHIRRERSRTCISDAPPRTACNVNSHHITTYSLGELPRSDRLPRSQHLRLTSMGRVWSHAIAVSSLFLRRAFMKCVSARLPRACCGACASATGRGLWAGLAECLGRRALV